MLSHSSCLFSHWSVAVGGLWLVRFHSSCLFHTGRSLLVDFGLCAPIRLVFFFTLVRRCWWSLTCVLPLVLSFLTLVSRCWWTLACALPLVLSFFTLVSRCWWTLACALPLVLSFSHWSVAVGGLWLVISHSSCLFSHWSVAVGGLWLVRFHPSCLF